jgi:Putative metal-binding motif
MHGLRRLTLAGAVLWSAGAAMPVHAEPPNATHKSGEIRGRLTYCAAGSTVGAVAHLPGKSFEARLGPTGDFQLYWVPVGRHSVAIDAPGRATHTIEDVVVLDRRITDLAAISVCADADGDSANEDVDCNDNNPNIRPGAAESCDGYDNNCDGTVDEGCATCTDADHDGFFAQGHCGGPIDCDDTHAITRPGAQEICDGLDNDCDADTDEGFNLQSDPSNCGACGTVCPIRGFGQPAACSAGACLIPFETCDHVDNDLDGLIDEGFDVGTPCFCANPFFIRTRDCSADGESTYCAGCP